MAICTHDKVTLLNPYELIRKYKCNSCSLIMMCSSDRYIGENFLAHQLKQATELHTQKRFSVLGGFYNDICPECRGEKAIPYPKAQMYGATSKFQRYYWREIHLEVIKEFGEFCFAKGESDSIMASTTFPQEYQKIEEKVYKKYKKLHQESPKYIFQEESQDEIIVKYGVELIQLKGEYISSEKRALILFNNEAVGVEKFAQNFFKEQEFLAIELESIPFHVIFATFMSHIISDINDENVLLVSFGDRNAFADGQKGIDNIVWCYLPDDFGTIGYWNRRKNIIEEYIMDLPNAHNGLLKHFDSMSTLSSTDDLRQYLWACKEEDISRARQVLAILPVDKTKRALIYLSKNYWGNYLGWPDLLFYKKDKSKYFVAEVKSSKDKLSEDQKNWIKGNNRDLGLPFKLIKITKQK